MWIKFCGLVRPEDFEVAVSLAVDAIGVIAVPGTPRCVTAEEGSILSCLPRGNSKLTLVFQDPEANYAKEMISALQPDLLQFHGSESHRDIAAYGLPYLKTVRGVRRRDVELLSEHRDAFAWLIDVPDLNYDVAGRMYHLRDAHPQRQLIVAGGLNLSNISRIMQHVRPWGVDISRGIEMTPRQKDHRLMKQFVEAVRHVSD